MISSRRLKALAGSVGLATLAACTVTPPPLPEDPGHELAGVAFFPQTAWHCGPAALATVLTSTGIAVTPAELAPQIYTPARRGSFQPELLAASRTAGRVPFVLETELSAVLAEVAAGRPVLVLQDLGRFGIRRWHYAVVVGHDPERDVLILRSGAERRRIESAADFLKSWQAGNRWAMVVTRPGEVPVSATPEAYVRMLADADNRLPESEAAYGAALARWPDSAPMLFAAANERYGKNDPVGAIPLYRRLLNVEPDHVAGANNLANALLDLGCVAEARATAEAAVKEAEARQEFVAETRDSLAKINGTAPSPPGDCRAPF